MNKIWGHEIMSIFLSISLNISFDMNGTFFLTCLSTHNICFECEIVKSLYKQRSNKKLGIKLKIFSYPTVSFSQFF